MLHLSDMPTYVLRVGQMSGDTVVGYWNLTEQYPLMVIGGAIHMKKVRTTHSTTKESMLFFY
jgi:hypothetical protein